MPSEEGMFLVPSDLSSISHYKPSWLWCSLFFFTLFSIFFDTIRSQTTKGIWLAKAQNIEPCTLVMDLEGTDGRERGEVIKLAYLQF
jgi:hypothetical protein